MLKVVAKMTVEADNLDELRELTTKLIDATVKEDGCITYNFCQQTEAAGSYAIIETWKNQDTLAAHMQSEHFCTLIPEISKLVVGKIEILVFEVLL